MRSTSWFLVFLCVSCVPEAPGVDGGADASTATEGVRGADAGVDARVAKEEAGAVRAIRGDGDPCAQCGEDRPACMEGQCVACLDDSHCAGACLVGATVADNACVECRGDGTCGKGVCDARAHRCVECAGDEDCARGVCDPETKACVACLQDAECPGVCLRADDAADNRCAQCRGDQDCQGDARCQDYICVGCVDDADCAGVCEPESKVCVACLDDGDCPGVCLMGMSVTDNACVECRGDDDCAGELCDTRDNVCVSCLNDSDCAEPGATRCSPRNECVECLQDGDCATGVCDRATYACVECLRDDECPMRCLVGADSAANRCVECRSGSDCAPGQLCDPATHGCVGCLGDSDCQAGQLCDPATQRCVGCLEDADCAAGELCDPATSACVECIDDGDCDDGQLCSAETDSCVQCLSDSDCPDASASRCGADNACQPCEVNADCAGIEGRGVCDTSGAGGECVECTGSEWGACSPFVCNSFTRTCTTRLAGQTGMCGECVSDAQCQQGMLCAQRDFFDLDVGYFCMWREEVAMCGTATQPFISGTDATSVDGVSARLCTSFTTTCTGFNDYGSECTAGDVPNYEVCGVTPAASDAFCLQNRCTLPCDWDPDCPQGSTCETSMSNLPAHCAE